MSEDLLKSLRDGGKTMDIDPRQEWETPPDFWKVIDDEFRFTLDACASKENAKCDQWWDWRADGLKAPWEPRTWCNPGFKNIGPWLKKALEESRRPLIGGDAVMVVMGLVNPSTNAWRNYGLKATEIRLLRPRVQFIAPPGVKQTSNPRENTLFIYRHNPHNRPVNIWTWEWKK